MNNKTYLNKITLKDLILDYLIQEIKKENHEECLKNKLQKYNNDVSIEQS